MLVADMPESMFNFTREVVEDVTRFETILDEVPWIRANFPRYDCWESTRLLAGLLTCPDCHTSTIRIEALVQLAVALSRGSMAPRRDDLIVWFNRHFWHLQLRLMEDPLEDVFISNVIDGSGNHRIFEGVWERNDYWLQCMLSECRFLPERTAYRAMMQSVAALLDLSEALAERNELPRNFEGGGTPKEQVYLPARDELVALADRVVFSVGDLDDLGIDPEALTPFVFPDGANDTILSAMLEHSPLERRPLLRRGNEFLVALPTALSIACRRLVLEVVESEGDLTELDRRLNQLQAHVVSREGLGRLDGEPWDSPNFPPWTSRPPFSLTFTPFKFDQDKFGVLCMIQPPLKNAAGLGFANFEDFSDRWRPVEEGIQRVVAHISATPGFRAGLFVLVIGGLGAPVALPVPELPATWQLVSYSVPNFVTLAALPDVDMLMLWRLATQVTRARSRGIDLINPNGDFNLLAAWRSADYALVPEDAPIGGGRLLLTPPINALLDIRLETRIRQDIHAARRNHPARWIEVERKTAHATFSETRRMPFYVAPLLLRRGELAGVVEAPGATWWVVSEVVPANDREKSMAFQMWDCICHWLVPVTAKLAERFPRANWVSEFRMTMPNLSSWRDEGEIESPAEDVPLTWALTQQDIVTLTVTEPFLHTFAQPINRAERAMVSTLLAAGAALLGETLPPADIATLRDSILPAGNARYLHVTVANDASYIANPGPSDAYLVREEVFAEVTQELGLAIAPQLRGRYSDDRGEVRRQVRAAVAHLKGEIAAKLRPLSRAAVIKRCFGVLDSLHRDHHSWNVSAAALHALNPDREELLREAHDQESKRAGTNVSARILIETALFDCASEGGEDIADNTLNEVLAMTQVLIRTADYDQPVRTDFPAGTVAVAKSGAFKIENEFLDSVRVAYIRTSFEEGFAAAAESYAKHFRPRPQRPLPPDFPAFNIALQAEFGLTCEQMVDVGEALNVVGSRQGTSILEMRRSELANVLAEKLEAPKESVVRFLEAMRLYPRPAWDANLPPNCETKDVFPWLFKRRFSVLRRPFTEVTLEADPQLIISPLLVRDALRYQIENAYAGHFPPDYFQTPVMRAFQQQAVDRRSKSFVAEVADIMTKSGFQTRTELAMADLGAPRELGDLDVLAWRAQPHPEIVVSECKAMRNARSTSEILGQLDQFRGEAGDMLDKHQRRMRWLTENRMALQRLTGINGFSLSGAIVTSHRVPMQFMPATRDRNEMFIDSSTWSKKYPPAL